MQAGSGHIGTSFSSLDIMSWLFLNELDVYAGDGTAPLAARLLLVEGPRRAGAVRRADRLGAADPELLHSLRRLAACPATRTSRRLDRGQHRLARDGHLQGQGHGRWPTACRARPRRIFVMTGDGELQEGQFWESLGRRRTAAWARSPSIVDHNKIQSDTWVQRVSRPRRSRGEVRAPSAGTSRAATATTWPRSTRTISRAGRPTDRPKVIIADTVKGKGVSFMEDTALPTGSFYAFHSRRAGRGRVRAGGWRS